MIRSCIFGLIATTALITSTAADAQHRGNGRGGWTGGSSVAGAQLRLPQRQAAPTAGRHMDPRSEQGWQPGHNMGPRPAHGAGPRPGHNMGPRPGHNAGPRPGHWGGGRWGGVIGGRWYAGHHAPGGWNAYRRPSRGWHLPRYWFAPSFFISDYSNWGLSTPPHGYNWVRYYDDAVLVDGGGRVEDFAYGVDWGAGASAYASDGYAEAQGSAGTSYGQSYAYSQESTVEPADEPGAYEYESRGTMYPAPAPKVTYAPPVAQVQPLPMGRGYASGVTYAGGYYYGAPMTTTVVVNTGMAATTVTEEIIEEEVVTYSPVRKIRKMVPTKRRVRTKTCYCR